MKITINHAGTIYAGDVKSALKAWQGIPDATVVIDAPDESSVTIDLDLTGKSYVASKKDGEAVHFTDATGKPVSESIASYLTKLAEVGKLWPENRAA